MSNAHSYYFDVLVVGGGPAGIAAAATAAKGRRVAIVDENPGLGGQIWRSHSFAPDSRHTVDRSAAEWYRRLQQEPFSHLSGLRVFDAPSNGVLHAEGPEGLYELRYGELILAIGARERFLPFPGWTLPNIMGAGGLQAMVKSGLPIARKRVVVAGSGPLLLAVAAYLRQHGANVVALCEQTPFHKLAKFSLQLLGTPQKLIQGLQYRLGLRSVPYHAGWWPVRAQGINHLESVTISNGRRTCELACDYLACGFHLVPNVDLPALLGCQLTGDYVQVDDFLHTTVPAVYCVGETTGIGGLEKSLLEGEIAGLASTGHSRQAQPLLRKRKKLLRFAARLEQAFALRPELRHVPDADTLVCRCEDVPLCRLREHTSWRAAKLHTRCGMGPCQGRVCGPATEFLFGWHVDSVRSPVLPVRYGTIAADPAAQR